MPGQGDFRYLLGSCSWIGPCPRRRQLLFAGEQGSGQRLPEEFVHPSPLSLEQKNLSLAGTAGEEAAREVHGDAGAVGGWAAPMQM